MSQTLVKIINGNLEGNVLDNAASEHTLSELLTVMRRMEKQTGPNSKKAAEAQRKNTAEVNKNTRATEELTKAKTTYKDALTWLGGRGFRLLSQSIGIFASGLSSASENIVNFSAEIINSQPEITDFTGALASSRLNILGFGTAIHQLTQLFVSNYRSFQTLTQNGIFLGDRISSLQSDFSAMGVSASTMSEILMQNTDQFSRFGSTTQGAIAALTGMRRVTGDTREELMRFGISFDEQAEIFARGFARNTIAMRMGTITQEQIVNLTARYARDLRRLSDLTGASANELEDAARRAEMETAFQIYLENLRASGEHGTQIANQLEQQVMTLSAAGAQGLADAIMGEVLNLPTLTDAATSARGFVNGADLAISDLISLSRNTNQTEEEFNQKRAEILRSLGEQQQLAEDSMLGVAALLSQTDTGAQEALNVARRFRYLRTDTEVFAGNIDSAGETILTFDSAMRELRLVISDLVTAITGSDGFIGLLNNASDGLRSFRQGLEIDIEDYNPFNEEGRRNIYNSFRSLMTSMSDSFTNFWNGPNAESLRNTISGFFRNMVEELILSINETTGFLRRSSRNIRESRLENAIAFGTEALSDSMSETRDELTRIYQSQLDNAIEQIERFGDINGTLSDYANRAIDEMSRFSTQEQIEEMRQRVEKAHDTFVENQISELIDQFEARQNSISQQISDLESRVFTDRSGIFGIGSKTAEEQRQEAEQRILQQQQDLSSELNERFNQLFDDVESDQLLSILNSLGIEIPQHMKDLITVLDGNTNGTVRDFGTEYGDRVNRRIGTLKATGMRAEPRDTVAQIHQGERVLNPQETSEYNQREESSSQRDMLKKLDELNTSMNTMIGLMTQELSVQTKTMKNISGLGPDLMKGVPG